MPPSLLNQLKALNERLTLNQKLSIIALTGVMIFGLLFFGYLVQREPYQLLLSDLDATSANTVVERLKGMNVPYRLADGGRSVLVPADRVDELRIDVASQGLPSKGRMGFELFDQGQWGITDFAEKVNYRRALEGELERTILGLEEVQQARVHLVMGKKSLFEGEEEPAKASVVIRVSEGASLNKKRVKGIGNLVAFAVEGLLPENVTVVDINGNLLSDSLDEDRNLSVAQMDLRSKVERDLCQKVVSILEPILGEDNVRVTASVQLDYSETTEKTQQVADPVLISRQTTEEVVNDNRRQGIPFRANAPEDAAAAAQQGAAANGRSMQSETANYEVSKTFRERILPSGGMLRQSLAVVVNDRLAQPPPAQEGEPPGEPVMQARSPEEMERIRALVAGTVGLNLERGDTLTVENVSFTGRPEEPSEVAGPGFWQSYRHIIYPVSRYLLVILIFGLFYLMIFRPVKKRVFAYVEVDRTDLKQLADTLNDPELLKQLGEAAGHEKALPPPKVVDRNAALKSDLLTIAKENPQAMTQLIRSWISEGI